jgi:monoamine oxidase
LIALFSDETSIEIEKNHLDEEYLTKMAIGHLHKIYKNIPTPKSIKSTNFSSNKHFYGSYTYPTSEHFVNDDCFLEISKSMNDLVFFAGEHTSEVILFLMKENWATVQGAYESGIREFKKIKNLI